MRTIITFCLALFAAQVLAAVITYNGLRGMVEAKNPKDTTPVSERLFVSEDEESGFIVRYKDGIMLREIIDKSKLHRVEIVVMVLREGDNNNHVFLQKVTPSDKPTFTLKPGDVIALMTFTKNR